MPASTENKTENKTELRKNLSPMAVWALAFGCVIGWGSFINPGKKFLTNSGVAGTAIAMILGALVMIIIAFSYAYMVPKYPKAGGEFTFTKMCFGKSMAFICGWFLVVAYLTNVPMVVLINGGSASASEIDEHNHESLITTEKPSEIFSPGHTEHQYCTTCNQVEKQGTEIPAILAIV